MDRGQCAIVFILYCVNGALQIVIIIIIIVG